LSHITEIITNILLLGYFRINDPYRLVIIFFILLLLRLPFLISPDWLTIPELHWLLLGEKMNDGAMLYAGVIDDMAPLSAIVYKGFNYLFGRSQLSLEIAGLIVFYFQIFYINFLALKHKMYNENNYLPALFYGLLGLLAFNLLSLSPAMMALTLFLFSLNHLLNHVETRSKTDSNLINIGIYTGLAILFYLPFIWMALFHVLVLLFFTNTLARRYMLMIYGMLVPVSIVWLFYIWNEESTAFYTRYLYSILTFSTGVPLEFSTIMTLFGFTIVLYLISSFKILTGLGFNIFQVRIQKTMFFGSMVMLGIWLLYAKKTGEGIILFFPWIAFFLSHFFLAFRNRLKRELTFLVYFVSIIVFYSAFAFKAFSWDPIKDYSSVLVGAEGESEALIYAKKKILVLGPDIRPYHYARVATPYFNWELSKDELEGTDYYDNLEMIDKKIRSDMPEFIVDQEGIASEIFQKIPLLGDEYQALNQGMYKRTTRSN